MANARGRSDSDSRWARRECERLAESAPDAWPRLLTPAEEWLLWREAARGAAQGYPFLDTDVLAESLQRASAQAAEYEITLVEDAPESESALLLAAQRDFAARCRALHAASDEIPGLARSESALIAGRSRARLIIEAERVAAEIPMCYGPSWRTF